MRKACHNPKWGGGGVVKLIICQIFLADIRYLPRRKAAFRAAEIIVEQEKVIICNVGLRIPGRKSEEATPYGRGRIAGFVLSQIPKSEGSGAPDICGEFAPPGTTGRVSCFPRSPNARDLGHPTLVGDSHLPELRDEFRAFPGPQKRGTWGTQHWWRIRTLRTKTCPRGPRTSTPRTRTCPRGPRNWGTRRCPLSFRRKAMNSFLA